MKETSLFWALNSVGELVHVSEVENGLKCECLCPICGEHLVAHQGKIKIPHFKHYSNNNCDNSPETSIHLAAKRLFLTKKKVLTPDLIAYVPDFGKQKVQSRKEYKLKNVFDEYKIDDFQPDIFAEIEVKRNGITYLVPFIIEIAVTHFVGSEKLAKIEKKGISAIEINLSKIERIKNDDELWNELINPDNIKWLFNSKLENLIIKQRDTKIQNEKDSEDRRLKREQEREQERKDQIQEFKKQKLSRRKIYGYKTVYCPKEKENNKDKKMMLTECESCRFYLGLHFETTYLDSNVYVICGLEAKRERIEDIE